MANNPWNQYEWIPLLLGPLIYPIMIFVPILVTILFLKLLEWIDSW